MFADTMADRDEDGNATIAAPHVWLEPVRAFTIAAMMDAVRDDLRMLGVEQDIFVSERAMVEAGKVDDAIVARVHQEGSACHTGERSCFFRTLSIDPQG